MYVFVSVTTIFISVWNLYESLWRTFQSHILCQHSLKNVKFKSISSLKNLNLNHSQKKYQYKVFSYLDLALYHHILHLHIHIYVCMFNVVPCVSLHLCVRSSVVNVHFTLTYPCHLCYRSHVSGAYMNTSFVFISAFAIFLIIGVQCWYFCVLCWICFMLDPNVNVKSKLYALRICLNFYWMYYICTCELAYTCTNTPEILFQEPEPEPEKKVVEKPKLKPKPAAPPPAPPKEDVKEKMFQLKGIKMLLQSFINLLHTSIQSSEMVLARNVLFFKVCAFKHDRAVRVALETCVFCCLRVLCLVMPQRKGIIAHR